MEKIILIAASVGIPASYVNDLIAYQTTWTNAWAAGGIGKINTRGRVETKDKTEARNAYEYSKPPQPLGLRAFIGAWVVKNPLVSDSQRIGLGVPVHKKTRTTHNVATENLVVFKSEGIGGGVVKTKCYSSGSSTLNPLAKTSNTGKKTSRPKKEDGYDIMKAWKIINRGDQLPQTANDAGMNKTMFTKAIIVQQFGMENSGLILCEFLQWYNSKHPELSGPWSDLQTTVIT